MQNTIENLFNEIFNQAEKEFDSFYEEFKKMFFLEEKSKHAKESLLKLDKLFKEKRKAISSDFVEIRKKMEEKGNAYTKAISGEIKDLGSSAMENLIHHLQKAKDVLDGKEPKKRGKDNFISKSFNFFRINIQHSQDFWQSISKIMTNDTNESVRIHMNEFIENAKNIISEYNENIRKK